MPLTPQITLTANLESIANGAELGGYLRITLCGYGPQLPTIPGTCMVADAGVPQIEGPQAGSTPISVLLWGNDVITPANTFYEIAILDPNKDVIQCGMYQFTGSGTTDLSNASQILPPFNLGFVITTMRYSICTRVLMVCNAPGPVIAVAYNGVFLDPSYYTITAGNPSQFTLSWTPDPGDNFYAFCLTH